MAKPDLNRWALIGYKDETGLGRMSQDLRALLPSLRFIVQPSERIQGHALEEGETALDPGCSAESLEALLFGLEGVIFFEKIPHPALLDVSENLGIATVCVPMWEWFNPFNPDWKRCSHFVCPNLFAQGLLRKLGFKNLSLLPWPINLELLPARSIRGPARTFVHNAGLYEPDDRKSTRETIAAFQKVKGTELRLIVRVQNGLDFPINDSRIEVRQGNLVEHQELYSEGDVIIQASKAEGLGFGILEAIASGIPVITTNYPPMNESALERSLLVTPRFGKYPCHQSSYIPHAHFKLPRLGNLVKRIEWCAHHDLQAVSRANRAWAEKQFHRETLAHRWESVLFNCPANLKLQPNA